MAKEKLDGTKQADSPAAEPKVDTCSVEGTRIIGTVAFAPEDRQLFDQDEQAIGVESLFVKSTFRALEGLLDGVQKEAEDKLSERSGLTLSQLVISRGSVMMVVFSVGREAGISVDDFEACDKAGAFLVNRLTALLGRVRADSPMIRLPEEENDRLLSVVAKIKRDGFKHRCMYCVTAGNIRSEAGLDWQLIEQRGKSPFVIDSKPTEEEVEGVLKKSEQGRRASLSRKDGGKAISFAIEHGSDLAHHAHALVLCGPATYRLQRTQKYCKAAPEIAKVDYQLVGIKITDTTVLEDLETHLNIVKKLLSE